MIMCLSCLRYFGRSARSERRIGLHVVVPVLGLLAFLLPLYAQAFDLNGLLNGGSVFHWAVPYPLNWAVWAAIIWIAVGVTLITFGRRSGSKLAGADADADADATEPAALRDSSANPRPADG